MLHFSSDPARLLQACTLETCINKCCGRNTDRHFCEGRARSWPAATAQTTLASPGLTPLNCHVKPRYFTRCPACTPPARAFSRPRRFATSLVPPANYHNSSTMSCPRYESVASRRDTSMKFRRGCIGGVSPHSVIRSPSRSSHHGRNHRDFASLVSSVTPGVAAPVEKDEPGQIDDDVPPLPTLPFPSLPFPPAATSLLDDEDERVFSTKQTARRRKAGRRRARSTEIVYFSLAKRRKIKGKQETTARDGGNQAGLRPGMDFPGANVERTVGIERPTG